MKLTFAIALALIGSPVLADPGHLLGAGGHDHIAAGVAIGLAVGVGLWSALKERRKRAGTDAGDGEPVDVGDEELQDA
ncbi:MAG TPA: hypothetical protein ENJ52_00535 [Aliiroseovarius sp.]|nr:hypothetical protein [Aliiroseovarius sp.]